MTSVKQTRLNNILVLTFIIASSSNIRLTQQNNIVEVTGAGASFPLDVYTSWIPAYETHRRPFKDVNMDYNSIGSGQGKARIKGEVEPHVDYAGSDSVLSDQDYRDFPDLQMFPTMAGAVVCIFNLPGISRLNMTMQQLAGIYSGRIRWWNDSSLIEINPEITLPERQIITTARRDKSGTTEIFTRALSSSDPEWEEKYGTFSLGVDENDRPYHWNPEAVHVFGLTNRGLSGMILSTRYSVGYLVMSEVTSMKLSYAFLRNRAGYFVAPTLTSVQKAMMATMFRFGSRMTASLSDPGGNESYPMAGYTYFIIRKSSMKNCETAKELVRYIEWFFTNPMAQDYCSGSDMVPLPFSLYNMVLEKVLKKVTCRGHNVYDLVREEKQAEMESLRSWVTPVYIASAFVGVILLVAAVVVTKKKTKTYRAVWKNEWKIEAWEINFYHLSPKQNNLKTVSLIPFSRNKIHPVENKRDSVWSSATPSISSRLGEWQGHMVYLKALDINKTLTFKQKKAILWMRQTIRHKNLTTFYGLVHLEGVYHSIMDYNSKGSLSNFLHRSNLNANTDLKFAICYELACGMNFLHKYNIIHGRLTSSSCYFDTNWSLKIDEWQRNKLEDKRDQYYTSEDVSSVTRWDAPEFWTAPEILQQRSNPTKSGDVYSFGMIMKEIFTRELPFSEYSTCRTPGEVLKDVIAVSLRPGFALTTPFTARAIMSLTWESDSSARPSFSEIREKILKTYSRGKAVVDSIIHLLEEYVSILEETVETAEAREKLVTDRDVNDLKLLPSSDVIQPQKHSSVTVVVCNLCDFMSLPSRLNSTQVVRMLTKLFQAFDDVTSSNNLFVFDVSFNSYKIVAGLPKLSNNHAQIAVQTALDLMASAQKINIEPNTFETVCLKIGVSSGSVFHGTLASNAGDKRFMCGDAVYVAAELADLAQPRTVLISQMTEQLLQSTTKWNVIQRQDPFMWKGTVLKTFWIQTNTNMFNLTTV